MIGITGAALQTALQYYDAWVDRDLDNAMSFVVDDIVCDAPPCLLEGIAMFRKFWNDFTGMCTSVTLVAAFGDDDSAVLLYDVETIPVDSAPVAEYLTVKNGKIISSRLVFDQTPFATFEDETQPELEAAKITC
jgi:SnoaL-like domain